jgi:hypothetical protein
MGSDANIGFFRGVVNDSLGLMCLDWKTVVLNCQSIIYRAERETVLQLFSNKKNSEVVRNSIRKAAALSYVILLITCKKY